THAGSDRSARSGNPSGASVGQPVARRGWVHHARKRCPGNFGHAVRSEAWSPSSPPDEGRPLWLLFAFYVTNRSRPSTPGRPSTMNGATSLRARSLRNEQERLGKESRLTGKFLGEVERGERSISLDNLYHVAGRARGPLVRSPTSATSNRSAPK